jgi:hypothetical protein
MKTNPLMPAILAMMLGIGGTGQQATAQQPVSGSSKAGNSGDAITRVDSSTHLARTQRSKRTAFSLMPSSRGVSVTGESGAASNSAVLGSGTVGAIPLWIDVRPNGDATLGDSLVTQLNGNIGIGIATPMSKLTVEGMIETTLGGYKFPDGTVQTTAAVSGLQTVSHDATLTGNGTLSSPLGLAVPLTLFADWPGPIFTIRNSRVGGSGIHSISAEGGDGVYGEGGNGGGVKGGIGVYGAGGNTSAGDAGDGVYGTGGLSGFGGTGLFARGGNGSTIGLAAVFGGGVHVDGNLDVIGPAGGGNLTVTGNLDVQGSKNFKIDHPLDPENKYLLHSAIESSEVLNVYSGNVVSNAAGEAVVTLPNWFEALNRDLRYELTVVGTFAQAIVANEVQNNRL